MNKTLRRAAPHALALAAAFVASQAQAVDFDGYFRVGPGATSKNAARACYNLGISGGHYRLGNECDFYGEFGLAQTGTTEGVTWKAKLMFNEYNGGTDIGGSSSSFSQMYVEGKGFDIAPGTNFWVGKRFYGRKDVHILDTFFVKMDGVGAGADQISLGSAKLGVAYFGSDGGATGTATNPGTRINVDVTEIAVNPGGQLRVTGTFTKGRYDNATNGKGTAGAGLSLQHTQELQALGGANTLWLQYAQGSAGLDANFGTANAESSVKKLRLVESFTWQAGAFGGQAVALIGQQGKDDVNATAKFKEMSIGGRGSYALTKNFKLVAEAGYMQKKPDGSDTQKLTKFTFAPTLSTGPGFWNRPELRLYVTTAKWNDAANTAAGLGGLTGLGNGKTRGTSFGAQAEVWF
ncbi:MAG: carbohydrate porin [Cytophagales bacterium]|nr:carbohydrate porin [Rhizobacter sp.]